MYAKFKGERYVRLVYSENASPYAVNGWAVFDLIDGTISNNLYGQARMEECVNGCIEYL